MTLARSNTIDSTPALALHRGGVTATQGRHFLELTRLELGGHGASGREARQPLDATGFFPLRRVPRALGSAVLSFLESASFEGAGWPGRLSGDFLPWPAVFVGFTRTGPGGQASTREPPGPAFFFRRRKRWR